jgi:AraC-like DNA-binding protein
VSRPSNLFGVHYGRAFYGRHAALARHRHDLPYVALVLSGSYVEAGDRGRRRVEAGDLLVHEPFEPHRDEMGNSGAEVLNLPLPDGAALPACGRASDPDLLARLCERSPREAAEALADLVSDGPAPLGEWPDLLAAACWNERDLRIGEWASRHGLAGATVSRGFARVYGVTPIRFRAEARSRRAWQAIMGTAEPLAAIAADAGFADQAHMTRSVATLTGRPAGRWRAEGQMDSRPG